jgi:hypothetical protein
VPADEWLAGPLASALRSHVSGGPLVEDGWFDKATVTSLVNAQTNGTARNASILWPLLTLGIWLDARQ